MPYIIVSYGIICFFFIFFYYDIPKDARKYFKTFYTFFEYVVFASIFWFNVKEKAKRLIILISLFFFAFQIFYVLTGKVSRIDSIPIGVETIILIFYIFYFFYQYSKDDNNNFIYYHYAFWISVGILIYLGGSFFFFILIDHLEKDEIALFGNLTYVAEIIKNILFAMSIYIYSKKFSKNQLQKQENVPLLDHF